MVSGPSSNASEPVTTSANSPDTLPITGYTVDQLKNYVIRQLGGPIWNVELSNQQILDHIQDALSLYSQWVPNIKVGNLILTRGQHKYLSGVNVGLGIVQVDFVEPNPVPTEIFYGNLINPAPLFRTGLDEYDVFLRWRKTWQRVTSIRPDWFYDDTEQCLYIHNPIERYQCGIFAYWPFERTEKLTYAGSDWVKRYALATSKLQLAELWMKYSGAIPGPGQNLQMDQQKRDQAVTEVDKLMEQLKGMQKHTPAMID
jgi:hypothetical protein